ncbi:hypothetical protein BDN72DRAFT_859765 [Pluteus cervinus]|uniref:Uncharacterized protein n=1 Tax=Pluteus cervinus TaxID=181527 RepID=A0ACD3AM81_9AGAR|nr:hypothetical protein BDN72DRAFT_859765 [Pluteus cervinus]
MAGTRLYQRCDLLPTYLEDICSFRLPPRPPQVWQKRRLRGVAPMTFYDRHVNENRRLRHVALLPTLVDDITKHVDDHLAGLKARGEGPLPIVKQTKGQYRHSVRGFRCEGTSTDANTLYYTTTIASTCLALVSNWVIHPQAPRYYESLTLDGPSVPIPHADDPDADLSIRFLPPSEIHPDVLSSIDDDTRNALRDWHGRDLVTWIFLPIASHTEELVQDLDRLSTLPGIPSASCAMDGYPSTIATDPPTCDADVTPWTIPAEARVVTHPATTSDDIPLSPLKRRASTISRKSPSSRFEKMNDSTAEGLAHYAWRLAVCQDTTIIVFNCGSYERIAIRHRASHTLYISDMLDVTKYGYGKFHLGLQMAAVGDALRRYRKAHTAARSVPLCGPHFSLGKRTRGAVVINSDDLRRSKRQKLNKLLVGARSIDNHDKQIFCREVGPRQVALIRISSGGLDSTIPASSRRIGAAYPSSNPGPICNSWSWTNSYKSSECFVLTLQSYLSAGGTGRVYAAEITLPDNDKVSQKVAAKVATSKEARDRLRREYEVYRRLWTHDVRRIPKIYGLFEDGDDMASVLLMELAAFSFRQREPVTLENNGVLKDISTSDKAICLAIVQSIHRAGVAHGDLRPENLVIAQDGKPMVIDFDHARLDASDQLKVIFIVLKTTDELCYSSSASGIRISSSRFKQGPTTIMGSFVSLVHALDDPVGLRSLLLPSILNTIFTFKRQLIIPADNDQKDRRLVGVAPLTFLDRHVNEGQSLKHVVLLPSLCTDIQRHVDSTLEELKNQGLGPLPLRLRTWGEFKDRLNVGLMSDFQFQTMILFYYRSIVATCLPLTSSWVVHPRAPKYFHTIVSSKKRLRPRGTDNDDTHDYSSIAFPQFSRIRDEVLSSIDDDDVKAALQEWENRDVLTTVFVPLAPHSEQLVRDLDTLAQLPVLPSASCTTRGYPIVIENGSTCDASDTPWTLPLAKAETGTEHAVNATESGVINPNPTPSKASSKFEEMKDSTPEGLAHHAWRLAVSQDTTVIVFNCGNHERIGIRHRGSRTLYISDMIDITQPGYDGRRRGCLKSLPKVSVPDDELSNGKINQEATSKGEEIVMPVLRRSKRQKMNALRDEARGSSELSKQDSQESTTRLYCEYELIFLQILWKEMSRRSLVLLRMTGNGLNSSYPASCIRTGEPLSPSNPTPPVAALPTWKASYQSSEYFVLTLYSNCGAGATGQVYAADLQITLPTGRKSSRGVAAKLSIFPKGRDQLRHEYSIYKCLWGRGVKRIPEIYGLFEDLDNQATILVMERVAFTFRQREPRTTENQGLLKEVTQAEKVACITIVDIIHRAGIIHRDLRPENLAFGQDGKPMVIDFDVALLESSERHKSHEMRCLEVLLDGESLATAPYSQP